MEQGPPIEIIFRRYQELCTSDFEFILSSKPAYPGAFVDHAY
jgi:hypothetical protein